MPGLTVLPQAPTAARFRRASYQKSLRSEERYLLKTTFAMGNRFAPSLGVLSAYPFLLLRETNVQRTGNLRGPPSGASREASPNGALTLYRE
jgi:hypothetical protein